MAWRLNGNALVVCNCDFAVSKTCRVQGGVQNDHSRRFAAYGPFEYS